MAAFFQVLMTLSIFGHAVSKSLASSPTTTSNTVDPMQLARLLVNNIYLEVEKKNCTAVQQCNSTNLFKSQDVKVLCSNFTDYIHCVENDKKCTSDSLTRNIKEAKEILLKCANNNAQTTSGRAPAITASSTMIPAVQAAIYFRDILTQLIAVQCTEALKCLPHGSVDVCGAVKGYIQCVENDSACIAKGIKDVLEPAKKTFATCTNNNAQTTIGSVPAITASSATMNPALQAAAYYADVLIALQAAQCTEAIKCAPDTSVDRNSYEAVCKAVKAYIDCVENDSKCAADQRVKDALATPKKTFATCSGSTIQVSMLLLMLLIIKNAIF